MKTRLRNTALLSSYLYCFDEKSFNNPYNLSSSSYKASEQYAYAKTWSSFLHVFGGGGLLRFLNNGFIIYIKFKKLQSWAPG